MRKFKFNLFICINCQNHLNEHTFGKWWQIYCPEEEEPTLEDIDKYIDEATGVTETMKENKESS